MHVHQIPLLPDRIEQQPAPKPEDAARVRAAFEQMTALTVDERSQNDPRQAQGEKPQPVKAERKQTAAVRQLARAAHDGGLDILV